MGLGGLAAYMDRRLFTSALTASAAVLMTLGDARSSLEPPHTALLIDSHVRGGVTGEPTIVVGHTNNFIHHADIRVSL